jgi:hypothetical protein
MHEFSANLHVPKCMHAELHAYIYDSPPAGGGGHAIESILEGTRGQGTL